jgi:hypothetical protein
VTYTAAQTAGDLNVVIVGWNDSTAQVSSVTDSSGNAYQLAVGPTRIKQISSNTANEAQAIYYAKNIKVGSANTVTVVFPSATADSDIRILEYSGIDPVNAFDGAVTFYDGSSLSTTGTLLTLNSMDLLVAANTVQGACSGPGAGFTQRLLSQFGDIAEDEIVTSPGLYTATAPVPTAGGAVMQMVAFRAAGSVLSQPGTTPPTVTITAPGAGRQP